MKKSLPLLVAMVLFCVASATAQISEGGTPLSFNNQLGFEKDVQTVHMPALDMERIHGEDIEAESLGEAAPPRFGVRIPVNYNLNNSGTWTTLSNGDRIWRLKLVSENALAMMLYYDNFNLPEGAQMFVYSGDEEEVLGAFTAKNNRDYGTFVNGLIEGNTSVIEYYEPVEVYGQGVISVSHVGHAYRYIFGDDNSRGSDPCEVDIKCSPEGDGQWATVKDGVVRVITSNNQGIGFCSGTLINNTAQDCKPYILTAWHCGTSSSTSHFNNFIVYFNFQFQNCGGGVVQSTSNTVTGMYNRANSGDNGGNNGSDFLLMECQSAIPGHFNAYYNGWDASNATVGSGVSIHHPSGDKKKISTFTGQLVSATWGGTPGTHWRVYWEATTNGHGVTEGGSSGSPIFDANGRVIGQLTGGSSYCTSPNSPDLYGKMSYNWTSNPGDDLKDWLDPGNTGALTLDGHYSPCTIGIDEITLQNAVNIYPNPSTGSFMIEFEDLKKDISIDVVNSIGDLVSTATIRSGVQIYDLDLSTMATGLYYVKISDSKSSVTKKISIIK
jgi:hypothetical protein